MTKKSTEIVWREYHPEIIRGYNGKVRVYQIDFYPKRKIKYVIWKGMRRLGKRCSLEQALHLANRNWEIEGLTRLRKFSWNQKTKIHYRRRL